MISAFQSDSGGTPAHERLYNRRNEMPKAFERHTPTWERESAECTFAPELIAEPPPSTDHTAIPGYEGTINRLRNATMQREEQAETLTRSAYTDASYERSRQLSAAGPKPFHHWSDKRTDSRKSRKARSAIGASLKLAYVKFDGLDCICTSTSEKQGTGEFQ